jgi:pantetheine-phosphate adenylyltransferase
MDRIAVFPGSFDPITKGHESVVVRSLELFDKIIVAIGENSEKRSYFTLEQRLQWLSLVFSPYKKVEIQTYRGLTVEFCRMVNARYILRGLRTAADFEFERGIGQINRVLNDGLETIFLLTLPELSAISSSIIRDIIRNGGDAGPFLPDKISL